MILGPIASRIPPIGLVENVVDFLPVLGIALILASMFMMMRKRRQQRASEPTAREQLQRTNQQQGMRDDLQSLMVEIEQMAKRLSSQLDSKTVRLEKLLEEADQKIAELDRRQQNHDAAAPSRGPDHHQTERTPETAPSSPSHTARPEPDGRRNATHVATSNTVSQAQSPGAPDDPLTRSVYELADEGKNPGQIASELDEHVGKVELILALRKS